MRANYLKLSGARTPSEFFFFDTESGYKAAYAAARRAQPGGVLAVFHPLQSMPDDVRCIGHAPITNASGSFWKCDNCGQTGSRDN